jgi:hypothetical protein
MQRAFIKLELQFLDSLPVQRLLHRDGAKGMGALLLLMEYLRRCTDCVGLLSAIPHLASECKMRKASLMNILHDKELFVVLDDGRFYCPYLNVTMNKCEPNSNLTALQLTDNQYKSLYIEDRTIVKKERKKKSDSRGTVADAVPSSDIPEPGEVCTSSDGTMRVIFPDEPMGKPSPAGREKGEIDTAGMSATNRALIRSPAPSGTSENCESIPLTSQKDTFWSAKAYLLPSESLPFTLRKLTFYPAKAYLWQRKRIPFAPAALL